MDMNNLSKLMKVAKGEIKADIVLKNSNYVNVFAQEINSGDIAIVDDVIVGIGNYDGNIEVDCENQYITPGFIDGHVHIESSKVIPQIFSDTVLNRGITSCIVDPHEIANVLGLSGIDFMIRNSEKCLVDMYFMLPSCVPATDFEDNGAELKSDDLKKLIKNDKVLGLGEVMDALAVTNAEQGMMDKLALFANKPIDGHCPQIDEKLLNAYLIGGIATDHECVTVEEVIEKINMGMYVMLRQGSAARNLEQLLPAINSKNYHRFLFCTDDKDITDLEKEGSIDYNVRLAIKNGLDPIKAITIASLNAAQCYSLNKKGAIAPGYKADLVILDSLNDIAINKVIKDGKIINTNDTNRNYEIDNRGIVSTMNIDKITEDKFKVKAIGDKVNVIEIVNASIVTKLDTREIISSDCYVQGIKSDDALKIAVFERHKWTNKYSVGYIEGLGIKNCTIAQTIAHDSHNIIVCGDSDRDMTIAVNRLIELKGGIVLVSSGKIVSELALPIAGLMTNERKDYVVEQLEAMKDNLKIYGINKNIDPFITLGFMALPVIPEIKITTRGLYHFTQGKFIDLFV